MNLGYQNDLKISVARDAEDAVAMGFDYHQPHFKAATIDRAVVVLDGTVGHRATVDFIFIDESGQRHVAMVTMRLVEMITKIGGAKP